MCLKAFLSLFKLFLNNIRKVQLFVCQVCLQVIGYVRTDMSGSDYGYFIGKGPVRFNKAGITMGRIMSNYRGTGYPPWIM